MLVVVEGSHFLWKMVRRIVGVLVEIGRGGLDAAAAAELIAGSSDLPATADGTALGPVPQSRLLQGRRPREASPRGDAPGLISWPVRSADSFDASRHRALFTRTAYRRIAGTQDVEKRVPRTRRTTSA